MVDASLGTTLDAPARAPHSCVRYGIGGRTDRMIQPATAGRLEKAPAVAVDIAQRPDGGVV